MHQKEDFSNLNPAGSYQPLGDRNGVGNSIKVFAPATIANLVCGLMY